MYGVEFYRAADGECELQAFLDGLQSKAAKKCLAYIAALRQGPPLPASHAAHLRGKIWELRPEWGGTEYRFLYAQVGPERFVLLTAFVHNQRKAPPGAIDRAEQRLADYEARRRS